jgi:hypothetical protein
MCTAVIHPLLHQFKHVCLETFMAAKFCEMRLRSQPHQLVQVNQHFRGQLHLRHQVSDDNEMESVSSTLISLNHFT